MDEKPSYDDLLLKIKRLESANSKLIQNEFRIEALLALNQMTNVEEKEIKEYALESIVALTKSNAGYLHFVNEDKKSIELILWSRDVLKSCSAEKSTHYPLDHAGIWADSIRLRKPVVHNDYQKAQSKKGYPAGHFHVIRHLSVPIFGADKIVAVAGVVNKKTPYNDSDLSQTLLFMNSMWAILKQRKAVKEINTLREIIPICSFCKKIREDEGYWEKVDVYIHKHTQSEISHAICPDCLKEHYPDFDFKKLSSKV